MIVKNVPIHSTEYGHNARQRDDIALFNDYVVSDRPAKTTVVCRDIYILIHPTPGDDFFTLWQMVNIMHGNLNSKA